MDEAWNAPGQEIGGGSGGEDEGAVGIEGQADEAGSADYEGCLAVWSDADDATVSAP